MKSIWQEGVKLPTFDSLCGDHTTEVAIVGGGLAGLLTAYFLEKRGIPYVLLERGRIGQGTTAHTTGKITAQHGLAYHKISGRYGMNTAEGYYLANTAAIEKYLEITDGIDCDLEMRDNYVYSTSSRENLEKEMEVLDKLCIPAIFHENMELPIDVLGAVSFPTQAQFHPLKFLSQISKGLNIYENTHVKKIEDGILYFEKGTLRAGKIIVATHFPIINTSGFYFVKMYQHRSYVLGLSGATQINGMYVDEDKKGLSFRSYGRHLLLGGGGHRTGKNTGGLSALITACGELYPDAQIEYSFAAEDCITLDDMPYIGKYSSRKNDLFVATGFNKWGMCGSMLSAILLTDAIRDVKNEYAEVFLPNRSILHPRLFSNLFETTKNLLTPTAPRCAHLGCALKWNKQEHTWDCACHGSRFTEDGALLNNPANKDLK